MDDGLLMELADCGSPERLLAVIFQHRPQWTPAVPVRDLALSIGIEEIRTFDADGFEGALVANAGKTSGVILHRPGPEPRVRFTIAHELGHFLVPSHLGDSCTSAHLRERGTADPRRRKESEANRFAAGLLMPKPWLERDEANHDVDLSRIIAIRDRYRVSFEAAANRYVELSDLPCAIVSWKDGVVRYTRGNSRFPSLSPRRGDALPPPALDQARGPAGISEWIERDGGNWFQRRQGEHAAAVLQQTMLQREGFGVTLLQLPDTGKGDDDDEVEAAWATPRFSR